MDQRTRRRFIQTIEKFFPRELCEEMEEYPTFNTSLQHRDSGLNSDFVCGPLKDAVDSGEHIVKFVKTPWILSINMGHNYSDSRQTLMMGYYFMLSNKNRIVIYQPTEAVRESEGRWYPNPQALKFIFYQIPEEFVDKDYRCFDYVVDIIYRNRTNSI